MPSPPWFPSWLLHHRRVNHCPQYPTMFPKPRTEDERVRNDEAREFFAAWGQEMGRRRVTEAEAVEASDWMAGQGSQFLGDHLKLLMGRINVRRTEARLEAERAALRQASEDGRRERSRMEGLRDEWERMTPAARAPIEAEVKAGFPFFRDIERSFNFLCWSLLGERKAGAGKEVAA